MSTLTLQKVVLGTHPTPANNFLLDTDQAGALRVRRNADGSGGLLLTIDSAGQFTFAQPPKSTAVASMVELDGANGYGSTNTMIPRFTTVVTSQGSDITYADSATLGASFTINTAGVYAITYNRDAAAAARGGISRNSSQLTTAVNLITTTTCIAQNFMEGNNRSIGCGWTGYLAAGTVIRPHCDAVAFSTLKNGFTITRVS